MQIRIRPETLTTFLNRDKHILSFKCLILIIQYMQINLLENYFTVLEQTMLHTPFNKFTLNLTFKTTVITTSAFKFVLYIKFYHLILGW